MTTALVTGAGGFIARHLARALRRHGVTRIVGADVRASPAEGFDDWCVADLLDASAARGLLAVAQPTWVFHLVGAIRGTDAEIRASNVTTATHALDAARDAACVVLVGSAAEYGPVPAAEQPVRESRARAPVTAYGGAKREVSALGERTAREEGRRVVIARPFNAVGAGIPDTLVVGAIVRRLRAALAAPPPRTIRMGTTSSVRDFVAVEDVADGLVRAAERGRAGEAYNLCSGAGHTVADVLARLLALAAEPIAVERDAALVRAGEVDTLVGSWEKAARELEWRPTIPLDESLRAAWEATAAAGAVR